MGDKKYGASFDEIAIERLIDDPLGSVYIERSENIV